MSFSFVYDAHALGTWLQHFGRPILLLRFSCSGSVVLFFGMIFQSTLRLLFSVNSKETVKVDHLERGQNDEWTKQYMLLNTRMCENRENKNVEVWVLCDL